MNFRPIPSKLNEIGTKIVDAAYQVHKELGPGLLESVYEECLIYELNEKKLAVDKQVIVPISYRGKPLNSHLRIDLLVDDSVVIELKAVDTLLPIHESQLLTYLHLAQKRLGYLINFNVPIIKSGIKRMVL
ncbi:MAG: GxxExxY protein [Candidatus Marinimicrobia bacterium]|nr:GxxExxY protein [Candidatus Neomarinimicrobiota bacterium]